MSETNNIAVARKWNLEVINEHKIDALGEVVHDHYTWRGGTEGPWSAAISGGIDELKKFLSSNLSGEDRDLRIVIEDIFGSGDKVAVRMTMYHGAKPTNMAIAIYRFSEGKIIDDWACTTSVK